MGEKKARFLKYAVMATLIGIPVLFVLKWFFGFHILLIGSNSKALLYILGAIWNVSVGYFLFKIL